MSRSYNEAVFAMDEAGGLYRFRTDDSMRRSDDYSLSSAAGQVKGLVFPTTPSPTWSCAAPKEAI